MREEKIFWRQSLVLVFSSDVPGWSWRCNIQLCLINVLPQVEDFIAGSADFVLQTQDSVIGGLSKWADNTPDPLHTYLGLGGLAIAGYEGLADFDAALNVTKASLGQSGVSVASMNLGIN